MMPMMMKMCNSWRCCPQKPVVKRPFKHPATVVTHAVVVIIVIIMIIVIIIIIVITATKPTSIKLQQNSVPRIP